MSVTVNELTRELAGTRCRCGKAKPAKKTFCRECSFALPGPLLGRLYRPIREGYEEAYADAIDVLRDAGRIDGENASADASWYESALRDLALDVAEMRHCQKQYFRLRSRQALDASKRAEKRVDDLVERIDARLKGQGQRELF